MTSFRYFLFLILGLTVLPGYAKQKPGKKTKADQNKTVSTEILRKHSLVCNEMQAADWHSATVRLKELPPSDFNENYPYYSTEIVSRKASKVPMPTINNTNAVTKILSVLVAPVQVIASVASELGPDYINYEQLKKDTISLPYYFFYHAHLTKDPAEAMYFYNYIIQNGWDVATFMNGLNQNTLSRNLPALKKKPSDSVQKFKFNTYRNTSLTDDYVIKNIILFSVLGQDTCTIDRMFYEQWATPETDISPLYSEYQFLTKKITGVYPEYILNYPLQIAVYNNDFPTVRTLLRNGANPNAVTNPKGKMLFLGISPDREVQQFRKEQTCISLTQNPQMQALLKSYGGKTLFWIKASEFWKNLKESIGL